MRRSLRPALTKANRCSRGSRAGAPQSEAKSGRTALKYVPRPVIEVVLQDLLEAVQLAWERLNDATVSEATTKSGVAASQEDLWDDGTPIPEE